MIHRRKAPPQGSSLLAAGFLVLLVFLFFFRTLDAPFQFDDFNVIVHEPRIHSLEAWWQSMPGIRPLLKLSYALNWQLSSDAGGFHLLNVMIHAANSLLLWQWLRRVLAGHAAAEGIALTTALLWAVHPATTEAVSYVSGRSVSLMSFFMLCALLAAERIRNRPGAAGGHLLTGFFTLAALAVRETAWVLPLLITLTQMRDDKTLSEASRIAAGSWAATLLLALAAFAMADYRRLLYGSLGTRSLPDQVLGAVAAHAYLLQHPVLMLTPNIDPDLHPEHWSRNWLIACSALPLILIAIALRQGKDRPWLAIGLLWWLLAMLPAVVLPRLDIASDRHAYLPLAGLMLAATGLLQELFTVPWARRLVTASLVLCLGFATLIRNEDYRSPLALWSRTADQSPGKARVWNNLGVACRDAGMEDCAISAWQEALRLDPNNRRARMNLFLLMHPPAGRHPDPDS